MNINNLIKKLLVPAATIAAVSQGCDAPAGGEKEMNIHNHASVDTMRTKEIPLDKSLVEILDSARVFMPRTFFHETRFPQELIDEQRQWIVEYIASDRYLDRLINEISVQTGKSIDDSDVVRRARSLQTARMNTIENIRISINQENDDGAYFPQRRTTREQYQNGTPIVLRESSHPGSIQIGKNFMSRYRHQPVHELSHASTDATVYGDGFIDSTEVAIRERVKTGIEGDFRKSIDASISYGYLNAPTEVKARLDVFRFLLKKTDIYDASCEEFTVEHLKRVLKNQDILNDIDVVDLFGMVKTPTDLIWLMNNVA